MIADLIYYWFKSQRKSLYVQLGNEFCVSGFHVYRLAHGKSVRSKNDRKILERLVELGVVKDISPY